jgi:hypothetical protein
LLQAAEEQSVEQSSAMRVANVLNNSALGAVNAESIFFGLTSVAVVVRVFVFGPSTKGRSKEHEQATEFHFGNGDV